MKRLILSLFFVGILYGQNSYSISSDTSSFQLADSAITAYTAGDIVRDTISYGKKFLVWNVKGSGTTGYGSIVQALMDVDTANSTNATFDLLLFKDSTGLGAYLPANNSGYVSNYVYNKNLIGVIALTLVKYAYGADSSGAYALTTGKDIPFDVSYVSPSTKQIFGLLIATAAYQHKVVEKFRIRLWFKHLN